MADREYGFRTRAIHAGNIPDAVTGALPIYQSASFVFDDTDDAAARFALQKYGNIYSRLANPTIASFEERVASLEQGLGTVATASGLLAQFITFASLAGAGEIDIDFVLHGTEGPASAWASAAQIGDPLCVVGPDSRADQQGGGIEWRPGAATSVLIAGDETATPAICSVVESLPADAMGEVCVEVPTEADALALAAPAGVNVRWLARGGRAHGVRLSAAVHEWGLRRAAAQQDPAAVAAAPIATPEDEPTTEDILWEVPDAVDGGEYAWLAGEAGTITALRRHLVRDLGIDRRSVAFMGYWREGRAEAS